MSENKDEKRKEIAGAQKWLSQEGRNVRQADQLSCKGSWPIGENTREQTVIQPGYRDELEQGHAG
jgi:hypothetical protein